MTQRAQLRHIVNGVMLRDGAVLMARRASQKSSYPNMWSFPGGHIEPGETVVQALRREMTEELGIKIAGATPLHRMTVAHADSGMARFDLFRVTDWSGEPRIANDEHVLLSWMPLVHAARRPDLALVGYAKVLARLAG